MSRDPFPELVATMTRMLSGGVTPSSPHVHTWVWTPPDCTCDDDALEHAPKCPLSDPSVLAHYTFEVDSDAIASELGSNEG